MTTTPSPLPPPSALERVGGRDVDTTRPPVHRLQHAGTFGVDSSPSALLDVVEAAHPAAGVDALAAELRRRVGATAVSLLILDMNGEALVHLARRAQREQQADGERPSQQVEEAGPAARTALQEQRLQVVPDWDRGAGGVHVYAPVSSRGETVGVLELRLPMAPTPDVESYLAAAARTLAYVVIADRRHTDLYEIGERSSTMALEAEIQRRLLPPSYSCQGPQFALAGWQIPASSGGGDTFDYVVGERRLLLSVTDAMGHGVAAAQLASLAVNSLRNSRRAGLGPVEQARRAGDAVVEHAAPDQFVTALLVEIELDTGAAVMVNAGHVSPLLVRDGHVTEVNLEADLVLGVSAGTQYQTQPLQLEPGDRLVLLTDGMFEREAANAEISMVLANLPRMHPREAAQILTRAVLDVTGGAVRDDATVLVLDWYGAAGAAVLPQLSPA